MEKLPYSAQLLGSVVRALAIPTEELAARIAISGSTLRQGFAGKRLDPATRTNLLCGLFRDALGFAISAVHGGTAPRFLADAEKVAVRRCDSWDSLVSAWRVYDHGSRAQTAAARGAVRLWTFDLAARTAGVASLLGIRPPSELPDWMRWAVTSRGKGRLLNELREDAGLTRDALVAALDGDPSDSAIDQYLAGATERCQTEASRPTAEHLDRIARVLVRSGGEQHGAPLDLILRLHYALHELATQLATLGSWDLVTEAAGVFVSTWNACSSAIDRAGPGSRAAAAMLHVADGSRLLVGAAGERIELPGGAWRDALEAVQGDWFSYFMLEVRADERVPGWNANECRMPGSANDWALTAWFQRARLDDSAALAAMRRAVQLAPKDADLHLDLSSMLDGALIEDGPNGERARLNEALIEASIALDLRPKWIEGLMAKALLLNALGEAQAAEQVMTEALGLLSPRSDESMLRYHLALLAHKRGRPQVALRYLKPVLQRPDHAHARALAAQCEAELGNNGSALKLRAQARALGYR